MQITYMPYLNMGNHEEATILREALGVTIWNYSKKAADYIPDATIRGKVDAFMAANVNEAGEPVEGIGVLSIGAFDLRPYTPEEKSLCAEAALLLFIAGVARNGVLERSTSMGFTIATSENFTVVEQNFEPSGDGVATSDGYIVRILAGGYSISEVTFPRPAYTPASADTNGDGGLIKDLLKMRRKQKRIYRRLMQAIDMFRQAYYNDSKLSPESRVMLLTSAYEALFDLPESGQRRQLKEDFKRLFVLPTDRKVRYKSERGPGRPAEWETESIKVMWADKFYTLRNKIIHGTPLKPSDFIFCGKQRHFDIAVLFFILGLRKAMSGTSAVDETADRIIWEKHIDPSDATGRNNYEGFAYKKPDPLEVALAELTRRSR